MRWLVGSGPEERGKSRLSQRNSYRIVPWLLRLEAGHDVFPITIHERLCVGPNWWHIAGGQLARSAEADPPSSRGPVHLARRKRMSLMLIVVVAQDIIQERKKKGQPKEPSNSLSRDPLSIQQGYISPCYKKIMKPCERIGRSIANKKSRGAHENNQGFGGFSEVADRNVQHRRSATMFVRGKIRRGDAAKIN
jgi:hypothetical protein